MAYQLVVDTAEMHAARVAKSLPDVGEPCCFGGITFSADVEGVVLMQQKKRAEAR
ncbi:MAG: hypothetical protein SXV54_12975 [Chloroflexota bacterium]|nr:hypothetical protein [Chloroflexota bacterium]